MKVSVEVADDQDQTQATADATDNSTSTSKEVTPEEARPEEAKPEAAQPRGTQPRGAQPGAARPEGAAPEGARDAEAEERARVEAAIRAGEQAAEEELAADAAKKLSNAYAQRDELQAKLDAVQGDIDAANKKASEAAERLLRVQADWDNYRRRTAQERLDERERAAEKLVVSLLPVLDDMERAIEHAGQVAGSDGEENQFDQFVAGVVAVHDKMVATLEKQGVEVINPLGEAFDPLEHQAVGRVENADAFDETVAAVYQRGYRMGGRVIREAMVQVTYGGSKRPAEDLASEASEMQEGRETQQ